MADFCVDNTQQVEFDEKVVCGLWQCEALRASQKGKEELSPLQYHIKSLQYHIKTLQEEFAKKSNIPWI